jgi:hypothetical protein
LVLSIIRYRPSRLNKGKLCPESSNFRSTRARDKADWLDPLTAKEDKLLGKNKHIFELIEHEDF